MHAMAVQGLVLEPQLCSLAPQLLAAAVWEHSRVLRADLVFYSFS